MFMEITYQKQIMIQSRVNICRRALVEWLGSISPELDQWEPVNQRGSGSFVQAFPVHLKLSQ